MDVKLIGFDQNRLIIEIFFAVLPTGVSFFVCLFLLFSTLVGQVLSQKRCFGFTYIVYDIANKK